MTRGTTFIVLIALMGLLAVACATEPMRQMETNNAKIQVDELFTHDGCTVYRFYDEGYARYYVRCGTNGSTSFGDLHSSGKISYTLPQQIQTEIR